ncbi:MAG: hypothetical protein D3914_04055 [Candidatus Electrothrix sp. LOE2]|nr:hypothetical protein [Candidatus Electrothrix sp. LOE2]
MPELKLVSPGKREIRAIVEAALQNELSLLEAGIRRTEHKLKTFEEKYTMSTEKFIVAYENERLEETLDFAEWIGELRMLNRLHEKTETLKSIQVEGKIPTGDWQ